MSLCVLSALVQAAESGASVLGRWQTIDDKTGKPKSIVRIYEQNGLVFGQVEKLLDPAAEERCTRCSDDRKDKPIVGMVILRNMKKSGDEYSGGDILDPKTGSIYRCKLKLTDQGRKLSVRGYMGVSVIGRSQTWTRAD